MIKKIVKNCLLISLLAINTSCTYSNNKFLVYRDRCILSNEYTIFPIKKESILLNVPNNYVIENKEPKEVINDAIVFNNLELSNRAFIIAESLVGRFGSCLEIADIFLSEFFGRNIFAEQSIIVDEPRPGDILYYANGGLGVEHWGIYLNEDYSLQGNFNGSTIIMSGYLLNNASYPIFRRVIEWKYFHFYEKIMKILLTEC